MPDTIGNNSEPYVRESNMKQCADIVITFVAAIISSLLVPLLFIVYIWMFITGPRYTGIYSTLIRIFSDKPMYFRREYFIIFDFFDGIYNKIGHMYRWGRFTDIEMNKNNLGKISKLILGTTDTGIQFNAGKDIEKILFNYELTFNGSLLKFIAERNIVPLTGVIEKAYGNLRCNTIDDDDTKTNATELMREIVSVLDDTEVKDVDRKISEIMDYIDFVNTHKVNNASIIDL